MSVTLSNGTISNGKLALFSPLDFSPLIWLDADDLSTLVIDGSRNVSQWNDKSGNGNNATQGTASRKPLSVLSDLNGLNVINFERGTQEVMGTSFNWPLTFTLFCVARPETLSSNQRVLSSFDGTGGVDDGEYLLQYLGSTDRIVTFGGSVNASSTVTANTAALTTVTCAGGSGASVELFVNQVSAGTTLNNSTTATRPMYIGEDSPPHGSSPEYFDGDIVDIIMYGSVLTPSQIGTVERYLLTKWGI